MRLLARVAIAIAALAGAASVAGAAAAQANPCPSSTVLKVIDAAGHTQVTCGAVMSGAGQVLPGNEIYATDGAGNYYQITSDASGRLIVVNRSDGPVAPGAAPAGSTLVSGVYSSAPPTPTNGQAVALQVDAAGRLDVDVAGDNIAQESGGHLAAIDTSTSSAATSTSTTATNTGTTATEIGATTSPAAGSVNAQLASVATNTSSTAASTSTTATNVATGNTDLGPPGATACATDTGNCSLNALLQRLAQRLTTLNTTLGSPMQASGGSVTANAGTNLNTSLLALESGGNLAGAKADLDTLATDFGAPGATACGSDTASCSLNQQMQRLAQRLTTLNTTLGSPMQASGGSVTANAGTNLNTSALALESGGHLASVDTNTASTASEIGATTSPAAGSVNGQLASVATSASSTATNTSSTATNVAASNTDLGPPGATACATDTGNCSLNALLQRLAQRLTTLNTTLGSPMQASGGSVTANAGTNLNTSLLALESGGNLAGAKADLDTLATDFGAPGATACGSDTASCSLNQQMQRLAQRLTTLNTTLGSPMQASGGSVTANAGTNLNTSALALESGGHLASVDTNTASTASEIGATTSPAAGSVNGQLASVATSASSTATNTSSTATNVAASNTDLGPPGATACATDTGNCSLNALIQRLAQRLTTLNTTLGSPFQAGGSIGNTSFAATESGTWAVTANLPQGTVTETTVAMTGLWVKVWTAATAKRVIIGLPSDSSAYGDFSFNASLSGLATSAGVAFAEGAGGSFDFSGAEVPDTNLYVKATAGTTLTVQVFN